MKASKLYGLSAAVLAAFNAFSTAAAAPAAADSLTTVAERSGFQRTGRYEEVPQLCAAFARRWPSSVRCDTFGTTPEGRPMLAMVVSETGALTPSAAKARNLPVLLVQGGIHAGEIDGKDAGFLLMREMLEKHAGRGVLDKLMFVFVPVFNADGHERFGRWNRPNQVGPEEMGWRVTSQNYNLNRDYTKADAPEMQAMLRLLNTWDPILYVDLHVTDGAQFQHDIANLVEPVTVGDDTLKPLGKALQKETNERIARQGALPLSFYPSLRDGNDPASGFEDGAYPPRFSTGYWALSNRFAMLVETHSWKDYPTRVRLTHNTVLALAEITARDGGTWLKTAHAADANTRALAGKVLPLAFDNTDKKTMIDFKGYAYTREPSPISGALALRYDPTKPEIWHIPLYNEVVPTIEVKAPAGGYIVPAGHAAWMAQKLKDHGITYRTLSRPATDIAVEAFRATKAEFGTKPYEGHMTAKLTGEWAQEKASVPAGSLFVPFAQPKARLVFALLEPRGPDSFATWGFFNAHFESKEYMEDYVAEDVAREMLAKNPEIAAEFKQKLATDPAFARDSDARLEFFYKHHASWDTRLNLYPVLRTATDALPK